MGSDAFIIDGGSEIIPTGRSRGADVVVEDGGLFESSSSWSWSCWSMNSICSSMVRSRTVTGQSATIRPMLGHSRWINGVGGSRIANHDS